MASYKNFKIGCGRTASSTIVLDSTKVRDSGTGPALERIMGWTLTSTTVSTNYVYRLSKPLLDILPLGATYDSILAWNITVSGFSPTNTNCLKSGQNLVFMFTIPSTIDKNTEISLNAIISYTTTVTTYTPQIFKAVGCNAADSGNETGSGDCPDT